jgi:hypothetical protein
MGYWINNKDYQTRTSNNHRKALSDAVFNNPNKLLMKSIKITFGNDFMLL